MTMDGFLPAESFGADKGSQTAKVGEACQIEEERVRPSCVNRNVFNTGIGHAIDGSADCGGCGKRGNFLFRA